MRARCRLGAAAYPVLRMRAAIALAELDEVNHDFLVMNLNQAYPGECPNIVSALNRSLEPAIALLRTNASTAQAKLHDSLRMCKLQANDHTRRTPRI